MLDCIVYITTHIIGEIGDWVIEIRLQQWDKTTGIRTGQSEEDEKGQRYIAASYT